MAYGPSEERPISAVTNDVLLEPFAHVSTLWIASEQKNFHARKGVFFNFGKLVACRQ